jgi:hypothetical protein
MQWDDALPNAGFSTAEKSRLYLPQDPADDRPTVAAQRDDPDSTLHLVRRLIALRRSVPQLGTAAATRLLTTDYPFAYLRGDHHLVVVNPRCPASGPTPPGSCWSPRGTILTGWPPSTTTKTGMGKRWRTTSGSDCASTSATVAADGARHGAPSGADPATTRTSSRCATATPTASTASGSHRVRDRTGGCMPAA